MTDNLNFESNNTEPNNKEILCDNNNVNGETLNNTSLNPLTITLDKQQQFAVVSEFINQSNQQVQDNQEDQVDNKENYEEDYEEDEDLPQKVCDTLEYINKEKNKNKKKVYIALGLGVSFGIAVVGALTWFGINKLTVNKEN